MAKPKTNYIVDILMLITFIGSVITGLILYIWLPHGQRSGLKTFLEVSRHSWIDYHNWVSIAFMILVALHFILHWKWLVVMTKKILKKN